MALSANNLRVQVDTPIWEWCRTAPAVSTAISCATSADNGTANATHGRYIYYLISATGFYRYDTWSDTYIQLSSPAIAPATWADMKFSGAYGFEARALDATATTITAPAYFGSALVGFDIRIESGTGAGQRRTITSVAEPVVAYTGIMTAVGAGVTFTDTRITAAINQYAGYQVRIIAGNGISQVRRILHHTATVFTYADVTGYECDYNSNPVIPSPIFAAEAAGVGSVYNIESSVITVNSAWDVTPDASSHFVVESGGIFLASSAAATPFYTLQFYDIVSDTWYIRTANTAIMTAVGTAGAIERIARNGSLWSNGTATAGTTTTLTDSTKTWVPGEMVGKWVRFISGTKPAAGADMLRKITANTATELTWVGSITTAPDSTTKYRIEGFDAGITTSATSTTLTDTNAVAASWTTNRWANYRVVIVSGTGMGQERRIESNTATVLTLLNNKTWDVTPDATSGYIIIGDHDKIYMVLGGQSNMLEYCIDADFASSCRRFDFGSSRQGAVTLCNSAGVGGRRGQAINTLTRSGTTATCTTVNSHRLKVGDWVKIQGATGGDAATYNITTQVVSVTSNLIFTYTMGGTPGANATFTGFSTTTLTDATQNWTVNGWANYICYWATTNPVAATGLMTTVAMEIASNTATTLTFKTASTLPVNGAGRYVITERPAHGSGTLESGIATGGGQSTTVIADSSKSWAVNVYTGRRVKKTAGAGMGDVEGIISSNTATTLTITVVGTLPVANSTSYSILDEPVRGTGTNLLAAFNPSKAEAKGKYIYSPRGGAVHGWDRYNIVTNRWEMMTISPQIETLTTGTNCTYDGGDRIYFTKDATQRIYYLDLNSSWIHGAGQYPYLAPTGIASNRMEIIGTADGLKYLWINRASNVECFKQLMFY